MIYESKKHTKSSWIKRGGEDGITSKPWGFESMWAAFDGIHVKTLFIKEGGQTSLKYYRLKSEVLFFRSGQAEVTFGDELSLSDPVQHGLRIENVSAGDTLMVQGGSPYRIKALTDCEIIEIGNNVSDIPVRIKDNYGRETVDQS